jgi:S-adenosylmethionine-dependent methyltransferase
MLASPMFDMIVCHNVLEYLPDPPAGLERLARALRPGGALALAFGNAAHLPMQSAIVHRDLARAARELASGTAESSNIFGTQTHVLAHAALETQLRALGLETLAIYGVRCVVDLMDKAIADDPAHYDALLTLERGLSPNPAYRLAARFVQMIVRKAHP